MNTIDGVPLVRQRGDGSLQITGYATSLSCANCGTLTRVAEMLLDRATGEFICTACPSEDELRATHGEDAVAALVAMREGEPGAMTLDELARAYPAAELVA